MKTITLQSPGRLMLSDTPADHAPAPDEALIRIRQIGVCGTDIHAFRGEQPFFTFPRILGHEVSAEVVAVGTNVQHLAPGMHCALEPYFHCGQCSPCRRGATNCCQTLRVFGVHIDGGMREYARVPAAKLHPSATIPLDQLALVEPLAIGAHAVARGAVAPGERVLVVGAGPIGLAVTQFALLDGAQVMVMDVNVQRLSFCRRLWPEITTIDASAGGLAALTSVVGDDLPTTVFDATGSPQSMEAAFTYIDMAGRLIFVGFHRGNVAFNNPEFHRREVTLLGSRNALSADFPRIIDFLERGQINLAPWITHRATVDTLIESFPGWFERDSGLIKGIVAF